LANNAVFNFVHLKNVYKVFSQLKLIEESLLYLAGWYLISSVADPEGSYPDPDPSFIKQK
jgi:hypothetical protein